MTEHDKMVNFKANSQTVKEAKEKLEHGEMSEELRARLDEIAHGTDVSEENRLMDRLQTLREDRRDAESKISKWQEERDELDRKIERIETRLDELRDQEGEYDGVLAMLEADLQEGVRIMEGTDKVKRASQIGDCNPADVIQDLKDRNPDVPDMAFRQARGNESPNWKGDKTEQLSFEADSE